MADEIKTLLYKVCKATTIDELLSYEQDLSTAYSTLADNLLENNEFYILNFEDIKMLHDLNVPMMSYFGSSFYKDCGVVFLEKYNSKTLKFLDLSILFYSLQILKWIKTDNWEDEVSRNLFYEKNNSLFLQLLNGYYKSHFVQHDLLTWINRLLHIFYTDLPIDDIKAASELKEKFKLTDDDITLIKQLKNGNMTLIKQLAK